MENWIISPNDDKLETKGDGDVALEKNDEDSMNGKKDE